MNADATPIAADKSKNVPVTPFAADTGINVLMTSYHDRETFHEHPHLHDRETAS